MIQATSCRKKPPPLPSKAHRDSDAKPPAGKVNHVSRRKLAFLPTSPTASDPVPPLEPPAPFSFRCDRRRRVHGWVKSRFREIPCWLLSSLTHLAVFILLASLVIPLGDPNRAHTLVLQLLESEGEDEEIETLEPVTLVRDLDMAQDDLRPVPDPIPDPAPVELDLDDVDPVEPEPDQPVLDEPEGVEAQTVEPTPQVVKEASELAMNARQEGLAGDAPLPVSHLSTIAFQQVRPMGAVCTTAHLSAMPDPATGGVFDENSRERRRMDYVVDRFIAYDIGKLKGKAGMEAQRDFDQLGPEAIPALVDGLNRSAGLRQSCPVGVISRKLECALRETDDPAMIAYALENIGRGVPDNAPHADRLRGRKQRWTAEFLRRRETIQANLQALGLPEDDLLVEKVRQLSVAEDAEVEQALRDPDLRVRLASAVALGLRGRTGGKDGATVAGHVLVDALDDDDPLVRRIAQFNLTQLTGGSDLGENKQAWLDYWDIVERAERAGSSLPVQLVDGLDHAEWPVRREAVRAVAKVSDRLPAGQRGKVGERLTALLVDARPEIKRAAKEALVTLAHGHDACVGAPADELSAQQSAVRWREYWQQYRQELEAEPRAESLFLMACRLEESGREEMAAKRFRQIADEYPDTTAAARSRYHLDLVR